MEIWDGILVDTVILANFVFFSSMFCSLKMFERDRYPIKSNGWKDLSTFEARNSRQARAFLIGNRLIWARYQYLRVGLLTQYGNEFYFPVSLLWGHEMTMMEEFKHQGEISAGRVEEDIIEKVALEGVTVNIEEVQARVTAMTLAVEEAAPEEVYAVNEAPVRAIKNQRYHDLLAISRPVLGLEVEPLFSAEL